MKYSTSYDYQLAIVQHRPRLQRIFFAFALVSLLINFAYHISLSQIGPNPLSYQELDPLYLFWMLLHLQALLTGSAAWVVDGLLVASCVLSAIYNRSRLFPIVFFATHILYFVTYNSLAGHHYISIGLLIMSFPFVFSRPSRFASAFMLCRFVFCFIMFSAGCWKLVRGNLWQPDQAGMLLMTNYAEVLLSNTRSLQADTVRWLIVHRWATHAMWCGLIGLELLFALGFLTLRRDRLLLIAYLGFFVGGWVVFGVFNYDNLLFLITLEPVVRWIGRCKSRAVG